MRLGVILSLSCALLLAAGADTPFVGIQLGPVNEELAAYLGIEGGARVGAVEEGSPAEKAGLKVNDIITSWNEAAVASPEDLGQKVRASEAGKDVAVKVLRRGQEVAVTVTVGKREAPAAAVEAPKPAFLGVALSPVPPALREYLDLGDKPGVQIREVVKDSPAAQAGLKERDIIRSINGTAVEEPKALVELIGGLKAGDTVEVEYVRAGHEPEKAKVVLGERPKDLHAVRRGEAPQPGMPQIETGKGKITLRWRNPDGTEHEQTFETPLENWPEHFKFELPDMPGDAGAMEGVRRHVEESMKKAREQLEHFSKELREKHGELKHQFQEKGLRAEAGPDTKSVIVQGTTTFASSNDGEYEISVRTENDKKTVTVKKGGETIAQDLPFEKLDTLPADVQAKVKELDAGIVVKVQTSGGIQAPQHRPSKEGSEKPRAPKRQEKKFGLPTQTL